jgi:magnesium chelatase family protein
MPLLTEAGGKLRDRISGPLLDRIDIHVEAPAVEYRELSSDEHAESSQAIWERVLAVLKLQQERFAAKPKCRASAEKTHGLLKRIANWTLRGANSSTAPRKTPPGSQSLRSHPQGRARDRRSRREQGCSAAQAIQYRTLDGNL